MAAVGQPDPGIERSGGHGGDAGSRRLRSVGNARRPDRTRSRVVFRQRPHGRQPEGQSQRLLQPERRRCEQVAVCAGSRQTGVLGPHLRERQRARHMAGHASQQGRCLLGCAGHLPDVYRGDAGRSRAPARVAGSRRRARPPHARRAGDVVVAGNGYAVGGSRVWHRELLSRKLRARPEPDARLDPRRRAVRERMRGQRQHSRPGVSIAGLQHLAHRVLSMEGFDHAGDGLAQSQDRLPARADVRQSKLVHATTRT